MTAAMPLPLFEELHYFLLVVDAGSYSRAASLEQVTKSALSRGVSRLEQERGAAPLLQVRPAESEPALTAHGQW